MTPPARRATILPGSRLEQRYRALLRVLPASYRATWEEDMVATYLAGVPVEDAEAAEFAADYGRPEWSEVGSVLSLAVRLRIPGLRARVGGPGAAPSAVVWGDAVRLVALVGVLVNTISLGNGLLTQLWILRRIPWLPGPPSELLPVPSAGLRHELWLLTGVCWAAAFAALLVGYWPAAQVLGLLALLPETAQVFRTTGEFLDGARPDIFAVWTYLLVDAAVVLGLMAFHRAVPAPRRWPWLFALAAGAFALFTTETLMFRLDRLPPLDWSAMASIVLVVAAAIHLAVPRWRSPGRTVALAVMAALLLGVRLVTLLDYALFAPADQRSLLLALGFVEAVAVLAVGLPLTRLAARDVRAARPPTPTLLTM